MCTLLLFFVGTDSRCLRFFLGTPVNNGTIEEVRYLCDRLSVWYISGMICITICMDEFGVFLIFVDLSLPALKKHWYGISFVLEILFLECMIGSCGWCMRYILHSMYQIKEGRLCWGIHIATEMHDKLMKIVASLKMDVNENTNPVIDGSSMQSFSLFQLLYNNRCIHEYYLFKGCVHW